MIVVVCSNRESAIGSLVSTCTSSSSNWNLFCSSIWKFFAMRGSSSLVMFHFFLLRPFFTTLNFTLIFARTREWSDPMYTLWNDLVLSTADVHLSGSSQSCSTCGRVMSKYTYERVYAWRECLILWRCFPCKSITGVLLCRSSHRNQISQWLVPCFMIFAYHGIPVAHGDNNILFWERFGLHLSCL